MMEPKLEEVFGVSSQPVLSYVEREDVDNHFINALKSDKQIVIYGSSKQGKTALVSKHISYKDSISISLSPKHSLSDIYSSILRQAIFDFDRNTNKLQVVDSTFYFFLKHTNLSAILEELPNPLESFEEII